MSNDPRQAFWDSLESIRMLGVEVVMPRKPTKAQAEDPVNQLALLLRDSYIAAYVEHNPAHESPPDEEVRDTARRGSFGWKEIAGHLLRKGVRLP